MGAIIQLAERRIGDGAVQTVDARELHGFLGSRRDFTAWIKGRIAQYGFVEGQDYVRVDDPLAPPEVGAEVGCNAAPQNWGAQKPWGNRADRIDYALTLDMAKELAMVERTEKGKEARRYFIACERRAHAGSLDVAAALADPATLRQLLLGYAGRLAALEIRPPDPPARGRLRAALSVALTRAEGGGDAMDCIAHLAKTKPAERFKGAGQTTAECVATIMRDADADAAVTAQGLLALSGMRVYRDAGGRGGWLLGVANSHPGLTHIFRDSPWRTAPDITPGAWAASLRRLPGARTVNRRINGRATRQVAIPARQHVVDPWPGDGTPDIA